MSTGEVRLRDVTEDDLPIFFEHQRDPVANRMAAFPARDRDAFMEHWKTKVLGDDTVTKRTIVFDEQVAGNIVSFEMSGELLVGYWIGRDHWGPGEVRVHRRGGGLGVVRRRRDRGPHPAARPDVTKPARGVPTTRTTRRAGRRARAPSPA